MYFFIFSTSSNFLKSFHECQDIVNKSNLILYCDATKSKVDHFTEFIYNLILITKFFNLSNALYVILNLYIENYTTGKA